MDTYVMTKKKRGRPRKSPLLLSTNQQPCQTEESQLLNRITEAPEEIPTNESLANPSGAGSTEPSATSAGIDPFEAAVSEAGSHLEGEFAEAAGTETATAEATLHGEAEEDDEDLIGEILKPEHCKLYVDVPFDGLALLREKDYFKLQPHEKALLTPIIKKYMGILLRSSSSPEAAAFMLFLIMYGTRVGMLEFGEWLPKIRTFLGLASKTAD